VSRRWIMILFSSVGGAIIGWALLHSKNDSVFANALLFPGFLLSVPIYVLGGGVHGSGADLWAYSVVPFNLNSAVCVRKRKQ
jgi:hypothetical protein